MSEAIASSSSIAAVPEDVHAGLLIDESDVKSKLGHVAKFHPAVEGKYTPHDVEQTIEISEFRGLTTPKTNNQFVGLTKEVRRSLWRKDQPDLSCFRNWNPTSMIRSGNAFDGLSSFSIWSRSSYFCLGRCFWFWQVAVVHRNAALSGTKAKWSTKSI